MKTVPEPRWAITLAAVILGFSSGLVFGLRPAGQPTSGAVTAKPPKVKVKTPPDVTRRDKMLDTLPREPSPSVNIPGADLLAHVTYLDSVVGPRPAGSKAESKCLAYLEKTFRGAGYRTRRQRVKFKGGFTFNVVAQSKTVDGPEIVVGAHHDTVPAAPGAVDNASGIAVLLEVARAVASVAATEKLPYNVTFVAFGAEELGHQGSKHYVTTMPRKPAGMINLDMVGAASIFQIGHYRTNPWLMDEWVVHARREYTTVQSDAPFGGKSDYASFAAAGVPVAACAWDPEFGQKHSSRDCLRYLKSQGLVPDFTRQMAVTANSLAQLLTTRSPQNASQRHRAKSRGEKTSSVTAPSVPAPDYSLSARELKKMPAWELTLLRNEPFARHGKEFDNPKIQRHFQNQPWYRPRPDFQPSDLTRAESDFVKRIGDIEKKKRSRSP